MAELSPVAIRLLAAMRRSYDDQPTRCEIAADILEALALEDETLFDLDDELAPAVRAVRSARILSLVAELRRCANG